MSSAAYPTATQLDADVQLTPCRIAPTTPGPVGFGLGTTDQALPFQFSMRLPDGPPLPFMPTIAPTAQQSDPVTHETAKNPPPWPAGSGGWAASVQAVPFQLSTRGAKVPLELMFWMEIPTPRHCRALGQAEPRRMSSAPVPGVVATYHPEGAAALPTGDATTSATRRIVEREAAQARRRAGRDLSAGPAYAGARRAIIGPWLHEETADLWMVGPRRSGT